MPASHAVAHIGIFLEGERILAEAQSINNNLTDIGMAPSTNDSPQYGADRNNLVRHIPEPHVAATSSLTPQTAFFYIRKVTM